MVDSVDVDCAMNILGKQAVDIAQKTGTRTVGLVPVPSDDNSLCIYVRIRYGYGSVSCTSDHRGNA